MLLMPFYKCTGLIFPEFVEHCDTFPVIAFTHQHWDIQHTGAIIDRKVKAFAYTFLIGTAAEKLYPVPALCAKEGFKLAAAFAFQFK